MLLEVRNLKKYYRLEKKEKFYALDGVNIGFEKGEFVSIIGPSGCGKSTLLNIISGMDIPSEGELIIEGKSTKRYKNEDWDLYRRNNIGYIFQNFNLIEHLTALENVEIVMNLIGLSRKDRLARSKELLKRVGLEKYATHRPSELSGGQQQRVAIARALANDPDILLADEPTGALDKKTGIAIMELLKEVGKDKLVIMVTHNPQLAKTYSTRIVTMLDGKIEGEEIINNAANIDKKATLKKKKSKLPYIETLKLSLRNIKKKKARVIITSLAGSVGVIGIALVLGLGNGANKYIDTQINKFASSNVITVTHTMLDEVGQVTYSDDAADFTAIEANEQFVSIRPTIGIDNISTIYIEDKSVSGTLQALADKDNRSHLTDNYRGELPNGIDNEVLINEAFADSLMDALGLSKDTTEYADLIGKKITIKILEGQLFNPIEFEFTIVGVSRELNIMMEYIYFDYNQVQELLTNTKLSGEVIARTGTSLIDFASDYSYEMTIKDASKNLEVSEWIKDIANGGVGDRSLHFSDEVVTGNSANSLPILFKQVISQLILIAQIVMIAFISVAFVVSAILTAIVLYSSVLERKVEIGVLKAVGCKNRDVIRVFESEAILTGFFSGVLGLVIAFIAQPIANYFVSSNFGINNIVQIPLWTLPFTETVVPLASIVILIGMSVLVSAVAGYFPSRKATKMQVIDALRDE